MKSDNLSYFFNTIKNKVLFSLKLHDFDTVQTSLLEETFNVYQEKSETNLFSTSLSIFYFTVKTWGKEFNEQAELLGSFCTLYILALDLFDDVQDDDLAGKTYEKIGAPIAINNAITLLFLSLEFLVKAIELESDSDKRMNYLKIFNEASLLAVKGQHKDLMGIDGAKTTQEVINMQKDKASSISLLAKCAAIFSDCDNETIERYQSVSEKMVLIFQIVDDIRDIYGKKISPDLLTNKITYPIACFLESASDKELSSFNDLKKSLPDSIKEIRKLIYSSIKKSSETIEVLRMNIHEELSSLNIYSPSIRTLLHTIDSLANSIYKTPFLDVSKFIFQPGGEWHKYIKNLVNDFFDNMKSFNPPQKPLILPWHLPQWMYEPKRNIIFYSDIEGQPEEILPIQSKLMGISNLEDVKKVIVNQSPLIMSHELFHYWRKESGNLTQDYWYEEWVANNLAIAYVKTFLPDLSKETILLSKQILSNKENSLSSKGKEILERLFNPDYKPSAQMLGYEVDFDEMAFIQFSMINELYDQDFSLDETIKKFL